MNFYFINYTICFNSNVIKISRFFDAVCRNGIRSDVINEIC